MPITNSVNYLSSIGWQFVKANRLRLVKHEFIEELESHSDYPSLYSLNDVLTKYGYQPMSFQSSKFPEKMESIPFLTQWLGQEIILVKRLTNTYALLGTKDGPKKVLIREFNEHWTGLVFYIKPHHNTLLSYLKSSLRHLQLKNVLNLSIFILLVTLYISSLYKNPHHFGFELTQLVVSIIGLFTSRAIVNKEQNKSNTFFDRICNISESSNCMAVLNSRWGKIFGVPLTKLSILYFLSYSTILFLSVVFHWQAGLVILKVAHIIVPAVVIYSLVAQFAIIKQLCILCLLVDTLLVGQLLIGLPVTKTNLNAWDLSLAIIVILSCIRIYSILEEVDQKSEAIRNQNLILRYLKQKPKILSEIIDSSRRLNNIMQYTSILFTHGSSSKCVIVIINTQCKFCGKKIEEINFLLGKGQLHFNIGYIFLTSDLPSDSNRLICASLINLAKKMTLLEFNVELIKWYKTPNKREWLRRHKHIQPDEGCFLTLENHRQWCRDNSIYSTPTVILDGRRLPNFISIEDISILTASNSE